MIISVHIPKTAGNTFRAVLQQLFKVYIDNSFYETPVIPSGTTCIHGHFPSWRYDGAFAWPTKISWVRNPVERVISHYFFDKGGQWSLDGYDSYDREFHEKLRRGEIPLHEYAVYVKNIQSTYIPISSLSSFQFIGITEKMNWCLGYFFEMFNSGKRIVVEPHNVNMNPDYQEVREELPDSLIRYIADLNKESMILYEKVLNIWERLKW